MLFKQSDIFRRGVLNTQNLGIYFWIFCYKDFMEFKNCRMICNFLMIPACLVVNWKQQFSSRNLPGQSQNSTVFQSLGTWERLCRGKLLRNRTGPSSAHLYSMPCDPLCMNVRSSSRPRFRCTHSVYVGYVIPRGLFSGLTGSSCARGARNGIGMDGSVGTK